MRFVAKIDSRYWAREFPEEHGLKLKRKKSERGFVFHEFEDLYGQKCSIQNSSLATEGAIWLGVDNTGEQIDGPNGKRNEEVNARMHLTRKQVEALLPLLHEFVELGYLDKGK